MQNRIKVSCEVQASETVVVDTMETIGPLGFVNDISLLLAKT